MAEVRVATPSDAEVLARLLWDFNTEFATPVEPVSVLAPRFARLLARDDAYAVLAEPALGFGLVTLRPVIWFDGPVATLDELYVAPTRRSGGIGTALLDLARSTARGLGCPEMHINVDEVDEEARRFYERHGFVNIEPGEDYRMLCYIGPTDV